MRAESAYGVVRVDEHAALGRVSEELRSLSIVTNTNSPVAPSALVVEDK